jgi:prepilin-type processing-associated H-X9-DG protein
MEQQNQFNLFSFSPAYPVYYRNPQNRPGAGTNATIKNFLCPSAPAPYEYVTGLITVDYAVAPYDFNPASPGPDHVFSSCPGCQTMGRTNYLGVAGYYSPYYYPDYQGLFTYRSANTLVRCMDGTSNTFMFMEYAGGWIGWGGGGGIQNGVSGAMWSNGFNYTGFGTPCAANQINDPNAACWAMFGSRHTGNIVNVAYGDASVRHVTTGIDFSTYVFLSGFRDGVLVEPDN